MTDRGFWLGRKYFREMTVSMFPPAHLRKNHFKDQLKLWEPVLWDMRIWKNCWYSKN